MTITEALAELKTLTKRMDAKRSFVKQYLVRADNVKDPLEKDGGSEKAVAEALQAITDLEKRMVDLRLAIQAANEATAIKVDDVEKSIADWLIWRRDILPTKKNFVMNLNRMVSDARNQVKNYNATRDPYGQKMNAPVEAIDIKVNLDERNLSKEIELLEKIDGELDGMLSLKNATVMVEV